MLIVDGIIYSLQSHGGISVYFNEVLTRLNRDKVVHRSRVYDNATSHPATRSGNAEVLEPRFAERYRSCPVANSSDVFHSSYYRLPASRVPTVTTVHDFTYEWFVKGPRRWLHSWQKFAAIRGSQAIICISENTRKDLFHFLPDVPPERVHVVHNGVGEAFFPLNPVSIQAAEMPYVLFVGARSGYKNFAAVVTALAQLPDLRLVCVGGGPMRPEETALTNQCIGSRFVHRAGLSESELNALYNGAHCLVYPSAYEGFGIPVLEAMRAGCPVIAVNTSSIPEVAGDAALLLPDARPDTLRQALESMSTPNLREKLRLLGIRRAEQFSWERTYEETLKVYELVAGKPLVRAI